MNGSERRVAPRKKVMIPAVVSNRMWSSIIDCIICDASRTGCRLSSSELAEIPDEIYIKAKGLKRPIKGEIVWRANGMAGVQFSWDTPEPGDRRGEFRLESELSAVVSYQKEVHSNNCFVKNANSSGCMLISDNVAELPDEISIKFESSPQPIDGRIVWRNRNMAGVAFIRSEDDELPDELQPKQDEDGLLQDEDGLLQDEDQPETDSAIAFFI